MEEGELTERDKLEDALAKLKTEEVTHRPYAEWKKQMEATPIGIEKFKLMRDFLADFRDDAADHFKLANWFGVSAPLEEYVALADASFAGLDVTPHICGTYACLVGWTAHLDPASFERMYIDGVPDFRVYIDGVPDFRASVLADAPDVPEEGISDVAFYFGLPATMPHFDLDKEEVELPDYVIYEDSYHGACCNKWNSRLPERQHVIKHMDIVIAYVERLACKVEA